MTLESTLVLMLLFLDQDSSLFRLDLLNPSMAMLSSDASQA